MLEPNEWRQAAVNGWYDAQEHVGPADTDPEPYIMAAADEAVRAVLVSLRQVRCRALLTYAGAADVDRLLRLELGHA